MTIKGDERQSQFVRHPYLVTGSQLRPKSRLPATGIFAMRTSPESCTATLVFDTEPSAIDTKRTFNVFAAQPPRFSAVGCSGVLSGLALFARHDHVTNDRRRPNRQRRQFGDSSHQLIE